MPTSCSRELDWVVASVHTSFGSSEQAMTERMIAAIEHPLVDAIGHPTGRLIGRREPYAIDLPAVFTAAARARDDARDQRQPRPSRSLRHRTRAAPPRPACMIVIDSDAHRIDTLANMRWGIATARRAWLSAEDVANTRPWAELRATQAGAAVAALGRRSDRPPQRRNGTTRSSARADNSRASDRPGRSRNAAALARSSPTSRSSSARAIGSAA